MSIVNPWKEVYYNTQGAIYLNFDWKANKEYCVQVVEGEGPHEIGHSFIKIPYDMNVQTPSSGTIGWRVSGGHDHLLVAELNSFGVKRFRLERHQGDSRIVRISERDLVPDSSKLDPNDDTAEFEVWNTTRGRDLTLSQFETGYEYLFVVWCPQSSEERYYSAISFYNFESAYRFASKIHSRMVMYWGWMEWDDWFRLDGKTTNTRTKMKGPGNHQIYKIYRRKMNHDPSKQYYNSIISVSKPTNLFKDRNNVSKAKMPMDGEYVFASLDTHGDNELCCQGNMILSEKLIPLLDRQGAGAGFTHVSGRDHYIEVGGLKSSSFWWVDFKGGDGIEIFRKMEIEEYREPEPEPEPPTIPEPDPLVPCEDRCLRVGESYTAEVKIECNFINPPDWELRNYKYTWKANTRKLSLKETEDNGRIAIFKYTHTMREQDDLANIAYDVTVTVDDLDYASVGIQDKDTAKITFEHPCVITNNETAFSINNITVPECTPSDTDNTATFTVTSSEAIEGDDRTLKWRTVSGSAGSNDFVSGSGTLVFKEGDVSKTIDVTVKCDNVAEHDETFHVEIYDPEIGTISKGTGTATLTDDTPDITTVKLASEGESYEVYIFRDMSGSTTNGKDITLNGSSGASRDDTIVRILNDFEIPSSTIIGGEFASVSMFTSYVKHVLSTVPTSQKKVSILYITDATDGYINTSAFYRYSSPSNNHPPENTANTTEINIPDVEADESSTWNSTIGSIPSHIEEIKVTVVRILGEAAQQSGNAPSAEQGYNNIMSTAPSEVIAASFETFDSYTTGEQSVLNDRISEAVLNTYEAYCAKDENDKISVQAANKDEAKTKAKSILNCPDD